MEPLEGGTGRFIAENYDGVLLDQFGVLHDGEKPYAGANDCLQNLCERTAVYVLSNSTKRSSTIVSGLKKRGLDGSGLKGSITSGQLVFDALKNHSPLVSDLGRRCFVLEGDAGDIHTWVGDVEHEFVNNIEDADFILAMGVRHQVRHDGSVVDLGEFPMGVRPVLAVAKDKGLVMVCGNPDFRGPPGPNGEPGVVCPGELAKLYSEEYGGEVRYVGKPFKSMYDAAFEALRSHGVTDKTRVVMVGDSLYHDARGAQDAGIACVWIEGGVNATEIGIPSGPTPDGKPRNVNQARTVAQALGLSPEYISGGFVW